MAKDSPLGDTSVHPLPAGVDGMKLQHRRDVIDCTGMKVGVCELHKSSPWLLP